MKESYENPLTSRYASKEMQYLFSPAKKFGTWRKLWIALAEAEKELGLPITDAQIAELKAHAADINFEVAEAREREVRHDVMAHVYAYGLQCEAAKGIIHLGATSCYVTDNTDLIILFEGLQLLQGKMLIVMERLALFARAYKSLPTLGLTHLQPAQLVTVGKRATLWLQDLWLDYQDLEYLLSDYYLLGSKGTTGTQASFMELFEGDEDKVRQVDEKIAKKMGFKATFPVSGQTYPRKYDSRIVNWLAGVAQSSYKFAGDIRILQNMREIEEPFEKNQIGSSAMAYKRNPMRTERMCSLARHAMSLVQNTAMTASLQWFERTLDDSANRRLTLPEAFMAIDAVLELYANVVDGLEVYPKVILKHVQENLPFMATENILMEAVKLGGDRQELHELIRVYSQAAAYRVKAEGLENNLLEELAADAAFPVDWETLEKLLDPALYIGRCPEQVEEFLSACIDPLTGQLQGKTIGELRV